MYYKLSSVPIKVLYCPCDPFYGLNLARWLLKTSHLMSAVFLNPSQAFSHHLSGLAGAYVMPDTERICLGSNWGPGVRVCGSFLLASWLIGHGLGQGLVGFLDHSFFSPSHSP